MKHIKLYEDFVNEATTSWKKMMQGVRSSETGPWSIVAIQDRKVVGQSIDIKIQDLIPAKYEGLKKEFPKAKLHIEDGTGMVVWNESLTEGTYNSNREIAIYDGAEGLTHIEKRGKGYYGYNDEFDFVADDKADLEKKLKSWKYKLISGSIDEKIEYPEGVKTTDDKILDKVAKLLHSPKGIIEIGSGSVRGKKIPFQTDDSAYFNITGQKDHYVILCKNGEFEIPRNEIKNAEELYDQIEKAIQMGTITKGKKK